MSGEGSVTNWLGRLKAGDQAAAQPLWERYFQRLVGLARQRLHGRARRAADEEDVALSAFDTFCRGVERGRFPQLANRDDLWRLLVTLTARKASHLVRDAGRQKRAGAALHGLASAEEAAVEEVVGREPTPEFAALVAEEFQQLLGKLDDTPLARVALWKLEGYTNDEIAERLGCAPRTVERKVQLIRRLWQKESES